MDTLIVKLPLDASQIQRDLPGYLAVLVRELEKAIFDLSLRDMERAANITAADLADVGNVINTMDKYLGKMVWDSTNNKPVWAKGIAAADVWIDGTGSTVYSPS